MSNTGNKKKIFNKPQKKKKKKEQPMLNHTIKKKLRFEKCLFLVLNNFNKNDHILINKIKGIFLCQQ